MGLPQYVLAAIAKVRGLQCTQFEAAPLLGAGEPVYYWHSFNGVNYVRYALSLTPTESNICITAASRNIPGKRPDSLSIHAPSPWHFVESQGRLCSSDQALGIRDVVYVGDECPARVKIKFIAEKIDE
jgi:hypothetical protein